MRLLRGEFSSETVYGDPLEQAEAFVRPGPRACTSSTSTPPATRGAPNRERRARHRARAGVPVQVGGGVRDEARRGALLEGGVARVVVGTLAVEQPELLAAMARAVAGPGRSSASTTGRRSARRRGAPASVAVTGLGRADGGLELDDALAAPRGPASRRRRRDRHRPRRDRAQAPISAGLAQVLAVTELPVVASGGVAGGSDLARLAGLRAGGRRLAGAIVGRALLSGALSIEEAVAACER